MRQIYGEVNDGNIILWHTKLSTRKYFSIFDLYLSYDDRVILLLSIR